MGRNRQITSRGVGLPDSTLLIIPHDGSKQREADLVQCCHCGRHLLIASSQEDLLRTQLVQQLMAGQAVLGFCQRCNGVHCPTCDECVPYERQIENMEAGLPRTTPAPVRVAFPIAPDFQTR